MRGLFSRWIEGHVRLDGEGTSSSRRGGRGGYGHGGGERLLDNGSAYSSGESESEDSDQEQGSDYGSRSASPGSGLSSAASAGDRGVGSGGARQTESGSIRGSHGLDIDLSARGGGGGSGGGRGIGDDTVLWVTETDLGANGGMQRTLLQKRVGEFDGREVRNVLPSRVWVLW